MYIKQEVSSCVVRFVLCILRSSHISNVYIMCIYILAGPVKRAEENWPMHGSLI